MKAYRIVGGTFAHTSPYGGCWLEHYYRRGSADFFGEKVKTEAHLRLLLERQQAQPELIIMGNFIVERCGIQSVCRERGIDVICSEDGFFPHYETIHADPLGFCWESSLVRMTFRKITPRQREVARAHRSAWLAFKVQDLPHQVRPPYLLWPLQLIGDKVNRWDLDVSSWVPLLTHFRACLPKQIQLVVKPHPRAKPADETSFAAISQLSNTILLDQRCDLRSLIAKSCGVAGANSTVLLEARLMFSKPTYAYARGWFSNHPDLILPMNSRFDPRELPRQDRVMDPGLLKDEFLTDYADWFLYQLLVRQIDRETASDWRRLRERIARLSLSSFLMHGDSLFD